jgi:hypothetical protein
VGSGDLGAVPLRLPSARGRCVVIQKERRGDDATKVTASLLERALWRCTETKQAWAGPPGFRVWFELKGWDTSFALVVHGATREEAQEGARVRIARFARRLAELAGEEELLGLAPEDGRGGRRVTAREELLRMKVGEARRAPAIAAVLERVEREAHGEGVVDPALRVSRLIQWARHRIVRCLNQQPFPCAAVQALLALLAAFGEDSALSATRQRALRELIAAEVLNAIATEHVRLAREGGGA